MYYNSQFNNTNSKDEKNEDDFVVADMSNVHKPSIFGFIPKSGIRRPGFEKKGPVDMTYEAQMKDEPYELTREQRRWYILGTMKAALLISLAYVVGLTLVVLLFLFIMN